MSQVQLPPVVDVLPHRPPFLFLDHCTSCTELEVIGERYFGHEEPFFAGHFPGRPIVPGVVLIEGLAQSLAYFALQRTDGDMVLLTGVDKCRIRQPVHPGQTVRYHVTIEKIRTKWIFARGEVHRDDKLVLSAQLKGFIQRN